MAKSETREMIYRQQQRWAKQHRIEFDKDGYTRCLDDNLFEPLSPETSAEFGAGAGDELGRGGQRAKMQALHSSSALACNFFQHWRNRNDIDSIAIACGAPKGMTAMRFEQIHPTPLGGRPPHLDVEFYGAKVKPVAIESKFTEPYGRKTKREIRDSYLNPGLWESLPRCKELVKLIREEEKGWTSFSYLDVPQLLKHILGLATTFGHTGFELLYLWYEVPSPEAEKHRKEIEAFKDHIRDEVHFRDMTYQELFENIKKCPTAEDRYISYLAERYFPTK